MALHSSPGRGQAWCRHRESQHSPHTGPGADREGLKPPTRRSLHANPGVGASCPPTPMQQENIFPPPQSLPFLVSVVRTEHFCCGFTDEHGRDGDALAELLWRRERGSSQPKAPGRLPAAPPAWDQPSPPCNSLTIVPGHVQQPIRTHVVHNHRQVASLLRLEHLWEGHRAEREDGIPWRSFSHTHVPNSWGHTAPAPCHCALANPHASERGWQLSGAAHAMPRGSWERLPLAVGRLWGAPTPTMLHPAGASMVGSGPKLDQHLQDPLAVWTQVASSSLASSREAQAHPRPPPGSP